MSAEKERQYIIAKFPGFMWERRVNRMADDQVIAIYLRLKENENLPEEEPKEDPPNPQGTLF